MLARIEKTATGYSATTGKPLNSEAEGNTRDETLNRLRHVVAARLSEGVELVELTIPAPHPLAEFAGDMKNDPLYDEWVAEMKAYRQEREQDAKIALCRWVTD